MTENGFIIHRYKSVTSTNDVLKEMAEKGAPEWTAVVAEQQTEGRGREGRRWYSPRGSLYLSVLLKPAILPIELQRMPLIISYALAELLMQDGGDFALKWPNDILLNGRKVAGVLLEARTQGKDVHYIVAGMGINISLGQNSLPADLWDRVAVLEEIIGDWSIESMIKRIYSSLKIHHGSFRGEAWERIREKWSDYADWDTPVLLREGNREVAGYPQCLSDDGSLVLRTSEGVMNIHSGDITTG